jgi:hypothetical protein
VVTLSRCQSRCPGAPRHLPSPPAKPPPLDTEELRATALRCPHTCPPSRLSVIKAACAVVKAALGLRGHGRQELLPRRLVRSPSHGRAAYDWHPHGLLCILHCVVGDEDLTQLLHTLFIEGKCHFASPNCIVLLGLVLVGLKVVSSKPPPRIGKKG